MKKTSVTEKAPRFGLMEPSTRECGLTTKLMAKVPSGTFTVISILGNGWTIRRMVSEPIHMPMELSTKGFGRMTCSMDGAKSNGLTEASMKATTKMVANTDREATCGQMDRSIQANGLKTRSMVTAVMNGSTEELTRGIGLKIIWMASEPTLGQTVVST